MKTGWRFPQNDNGPEDGLNHPGIETFLKSPIESLAREIIQNSRDAAKDAKTPVRVDFSLYDVDRSAFPGIAEFSEILEQCGDFWESNEKTQKFFHKAKAISSADTIRFLKVSDYNTKGLRGSYEKRGTDWHKLTKSVGASDKGGGQDGSFGIGKHAPYACSALRTVFYGTKDIDGNVAFQGVCKLVSHLDGQGNSTQGTGYFGATNNLGPLHDLSKLDDFFTRSRYGTDVFIAGFDYGEDWEDKLIRSVLENFFVAIHSGELIVFVHGKRIDATSLSKWMSEYFGGETKGLTLQFYEAFTVENSYFFTDDDFCGLGRVDLHIAVGKEYSKQVAMFRRSGMLVYRKKHFRTPLRFAGVFVARGEELNNLLKSLEPPSHDEWQAARHEDQKQAASILRELNGWIVEKIKEISPVDDSEYIDPEGVSAFLPDENDTADNANVEPNVNEDGDESPKPVELQTRPVQPHGHNGSSGAVAGGEDGSGFEPRSPVGENDEDGGEESVDVGGGDDATDTDSGSFESNESASSQALGGRVQLASLRMFCTNPHTGEYRLACVPEISGEGHLAIEIVGEVGREFAPIVAAKLADSDKVLGVAAHGKIGPINFEAGKKVVLSVQLQNKLRCALEVAAYAN